MEKIQKIQKLLFEQPLYRWCGPGDRVLIRGDDEWAALFADQCLQAVQAMEGSILWQICRPETRREYLEARQDLPAFVNIDSDTAGVCGSLQFLTPDQWQKAGECPYVFCSGEDLPGTEGCLVRVRQGEILASREPVREASWEELNRMAFNAHLTWEGDGNIDFASAVSRFERPEYHAGSLAFALSLPYKLRAVGITETDPFAAAEQVDRLLHSDAPDDRYAVEMLTVLEHRRWMVERLTEGDLRFRESDYDRCLENCTLKPESEAGRRHPCLAESVPGPGLLQEAYESLQNWDAPCQEDRNLDPLDRMSLKLHRTMFQAAEKLREDPRRLRSLLYDLAEYCEETEARRNLDRLRFCIRNILDYNLPYGAQYESYDRALRESLPEGADRARHLLDQVGKLLFPALHLYRDYKQHDRDLIGRIPAILTAKYPVHLCLPLGSILNLDNSDYFKSVASATALYAREITYLYVPAPGEKPAYLYSRLKAIHSYFRYRGSRCILSLSVLTDRSWERKPEKLKKTLRDAEAAGYLDSWSLTSYENDGDLIAKTVELIRCSGADYYDGSNVLLNSPSLNGQLTREIPIPYLEFDSYNRRFCHCRGCRRLQYLPITSFLQVEDMFALMNAEDLKFNYQNYADTYLDYWDVYCGDAIGEKDFPLCARCWTKLSDVLKTGGGSNLEIRNQVIGTRDLQELQVIKAMLNALQRKGALRGLHIRPAKEPGMYQVSVDIADQHVKNMFSKAGELLEIYVYFEACRIGWFDDVQSGYQFRWEFGEVSNELDCVLTRGYRSLLVECKSTREGKETFYLTLDSLADHFGIGYKKVLIMVTDPDTDQYQNFLSRGDQMDIITLSERKDLDRIGDRLREIMES